MKYLVFSGDDYYPLGGMHDFDAAFDKEEVAIGYAMGVSKSELTWAHVVRLDDLKIVWPTKNQKAEEFFECGGCGCYHRKGWTGDCRDDDNRYTEDELPVGWIEVEE